MINDAEIAKRVRIFEAAGDIDKALDPSIEPPPPGLTIPVSLGTLIERIYVAPTASAWFTQLVESVTQKYGVSASVRQSDLARDPVF